MKVPIVSTDVGIVSTILSKNCIIDIENSLYIPTSEDIRIGYEQVKKFEIKLHKEKYKRLFETI